MAGRIFVVNVRDGFTPQYYTLNPRFDNLSADVLFRLFDIILDARKYFRLYRLVLGMDTDQVETALKIHQCSEIDWTKVALKDGFLSYEIKNSEVFDLKEEAVTAGRRARGVSVTSTSVNPPAIPVVHQNEVS